MMQTNKVVKNGAPDPCVHKVLLLSYEVYEDIHIPKNKSGRLFTPGNTSRVLYFTLCPRT